MPDRPDRNAPGGPGEDPSLEGLRSDLKRAARMHDHLTRLAGRMHIWLAFHALVAVSVLLALAWFYTHGHCCR